MSYRARFADGTSARLFEVDADIGADALTLTGDGIALTVPYAGLRLVSVGGDVRLTLADNPDARITLPDDAREALAAAAPKLFRGRSDLLRLSLSLVAAAAAVVGVVFVGLPMAAPVIARATPAGIETQMGANLATQVHALFGKCEGPEADAATAALAPMVDRLEAASRSAFPITLSLLEMEVPNALALPGGQVMVTRGLLNELEDPEELAAVLAHEIAHVEHRDGMTALYRHAGLGILLDIITGGSGLGQQIVMLAGQLTEVTYTRGQEEAADARALAILADAGHDPAALGRALARLKAWSDRVAKDENDDFEMPEWLASHPDIDARIALAKAAARAASSPALEAAVWARIRAGCNGADAAQ
jgi:Zn-dependent protease with chaperone function